MECNVKGITFHYEQAGGGRPLLLLHGWPADHRHMMHNYEPVFANRAGWRRIYPDLPGMGLTRAADWITCQDDMLDLVIAFMAEVAPGERFAVAGESYGGYLARGLVHHCASQLTGVMLVVPTIETDKGKTNLPRHRILHEDAEYMAALRPDEQGMLEVVVNQSMVVLNGSRAVYAGIAIADHPFLKGLRFPFSFDVDALAEPFEAPGLILTGRFDHWCGYREAFQRLDQYPRTTYAVLDCAGHALASEQRTLFQALMHEWLDRVENETAKRL